MKAAIKFAIWAGLAAMLFAGAAASKQVSDISAKAEELLSIKNATLDDVVRIFGEPVEYLWSGKTFTRENLPSVYIAFYPDNFKVVISNGRVDELRFESPDIGYVFRDKIRVGSSLDEVLEVLGQPEKVEEGQKKPELYEDGVLYKDIDGWKGFCYYGRADQNVRLFFTNYKVNALYVTCGDYEPGLGLGRHEPEKKAKVTKQSPPEQMREPDSEDGPVPDINAKAEKLLSIKNATLDDVVRIFGEPDKYGFGNKIFTRENLPSFYIAFYPNGFQVLIANGGVDELRFESPDIGYVFRDKIRVGTLLDEVLEVVGQPAETVVGEALPNIAKDGVLYKDINGRTGYCYYKPLNKNVRFFFGEYKVTALYVTCGSSARNNASGSFQTVRPVNSVKEFDDVRWKDLSKINLHKDEGLIETLTFNEKTIWPKPSRMPEGCIPEEILKSAMNPGLGVRELHKQGITGKGVNVAIIDQPLYLDHPEFEGKIAAYYDTGCGSESSMHGPAVASLLVGTNCGTAPDAKVYYAAAPSWTKDTAYQAKALDWIVEQNERLPVSEKIRVVSVSAAPSGPGSPFEKNKDMWDQACVRAEAKGILVLDCTQNHGFIGPCWYDSKEPEDVRECTPGFPISKGFMARPETILVPTSPRTTAEEYDKGDFNYQYCGSGGLSWAIPYCAGVLAMGWQIRPELSPEQMRDLLFKSAYTTGRAKIINPAKFIEQVKKAKADDRHKKN